MKRLEATLSGLRQRGEGAFMPFLVIGDPDLAATEALADRLIAAGSDILEFGFAFSDPPADGPVIQAADVRALAQGTTPADAFALLQRVRTRTEAPFTLLMYYNLILQFGVDAFYARCAEVGVDAVLVADLPVEEASPALAAAEAHGVAPIFIVSELTSVARLDAIRSSAKGYLYVVTHLGVTGERVSVAARLGELITRLRAGTDLPLLAGFGISAPAHVREVLDAGADGAIVGSALIRRIADHLGDTTAMLDAVGGLAAALKAATRRPD